MITPENPDILDEGEDLVLTCNALSSLSTKAFWYKVDLMVIGQILVYAEEMLGLFGKEDLYCNPQEIIEMKKCDSTRWCSG